MRQPSVYTVMDAINLVNSFHFEFAWNIIITRHSRVTHLTHSAHGWQTRVRLVHKMYGRPWIKLTNRRHAATHTSTRYRLHREYRVRQSVTLPPPQGKTQRSRLQNTFHSKTNRHLTYQRQQKSLHPTHSQERPHTTTHAVKSSQAKRQGSQALKIIISGPLPLESQLERLTTVHCLPVGSIK